MSAEESKIRDELERDIERDLEEELKGEIYHLAFRLHRLYQHQNERIGREETKNQQGKKSKMLSELNINIKMEGGTKIEIKEQKKEGSYREGKTVITAQKVRGDTKEFNWMNTLRSKQGPFCDNKKKNETQNKPKLPKSKPIFHENPKFIRDNKFFCVDSKLLELEWKG